MPAADRLAELRRQRAQIHDHLAWLDREIAAEERNAAATPVALPRIGGPEGSGSIGTVPAAAPHSRNTPVSAPPTPERPPSLASPPPTPVAAGADGTASATAEADALLDEYRVPAATLQKDVRKGCLLYFAAALLILAGIVAVLYYAVRR